MYCFTVNNGSSNKQYLIGQLNGTAVTSVKNVSRQGVETSGAAFAARAGSPVIISDFATIQRVADILRGQLPLDGANPVVYDAEPTLADRKELATVGYVLDAAFGGSLAFDNMTVAGNAGEAVVADNFVYFKTSDQEWYLTDADASATSVGVQLGIALGTGSDGAGISGGIQISGTWTTTGLTPGSVYYLSGTAGAITTTPGTNSRVVGLALSATKLLLVNHPVGGPFEGGSTFGNPSATNKFITQEYNSSATGLPVVRKYETSGSPHTWNKPTGLKYVVVEVQGGGGTGTNASGTASSDNAGNGGGSGGYSKKLIAVSSLGSTETVTVGAVGGNSSFGSHCSGNGASGGTAGTATGGDINITGKAGSDACDPDGDGDHQDGGRGGDSMFGFGGVSGSRNATGYGAGACGGDRASGQTGAGTATAGIVIVTEYYS
jgi:hypothetical protein